jgi:hypothetical protein
MSGARLPMGPREVTRNGADRLAAKLAEERAERELQDALQASIHSTCRRDHSAAQAWADTFRVDLATIYRWANGELRCGPVQDFFDAIGASIRAKGSDNPAAVELARLVRRRYLDPQADQRAVSPALVTGTIAETVEVVGSLLSTVIRNTSADSPGGTAITVEEWEAAQPAFERVAELFETLRLAMPAVMRRVPVVGGDGRPS